MNTAAAASGDDSAAAIVTADFEETARDLEELATHNEVSTRGTSSGASKKIEAAGAEKTPASQNRKWRDVSKIILFTV